MDNRFSYDGRSTSMDIHDSEQRQPRFSASSYQYGDDKNDAGGTVRDLGDDRKDVDQCTVNRALKWYHVIFITISGVLGIGLYVRSTDMLRVGGPGAVVIPFIVFTILAWMIMQCISEMILIWPVSGALRLFVKKFVDRELGVVVAASYWFTWALALAALLAAAANEANVWIEVNGPDYDDIKNRNQAVIISVAGAVVLFINLAPIKWYGWVEVVGGSVKVLLFFTLVGAMLVINLFGAGNCKEPLGLKQWRPHFLEVNLDVVKNWAGSFFIAMQVAAFAFTGIEIPAALAVEADIMHNKTIGSKPTGRLQRFKAKFFRWFTPDASPPANSTLKFSAVWLPVCFGAAYIVAGGLVSLNVGSNDHNLPKVTWTGFDLSNSTQLNGRSNTSSVSLCGVTTEIDSNSGFVITAHNAGLPGLKDATTGFLIFTAISSANTALYIASRTLYDLGRHVQAPEGPFLWPPTHLKKWPAKLVSLFGAVTPHNRCPSWAVLFSFFAFFWLPFLALKGGNSQPQVLWVLSSMGAECCVMVWACQCWAFIRFRKLIHEPANKAMIRERGIPFLTRNGKGGGTVDYPYKSSGQPAIAYIAIAGCLTVIIGPGIPLIWGVTTPVVGVSAYLAPAGFILLWIVLKLYNYGFTAKPWKHWIERVDFEHAVQELNDERDRGQIRDRSQIRVVEETSICKSCGAADAPHLCQHCGQPV